MTYEEALRALIAYEFEKGELSDDELHEVRDVVAQNVTRYAMQAFMVRLLSDGYIDDKHRADYEARVRNYAAGDGFMSDDQIQTRKKLEIDELLS